MRKEQTEKETVTKKIQGGNKIKLVEKQLLKLRTQQISYAEIRPSSRELMTQKTDPRKLSSKGLLPIKRKHGYEK